jgi:phage-related protein
MQQGKKIVARFYHTALGTSPVVEWLRSLPLDDRHAIGQDLARVEFGFPVGMPLCRALGNGLWEVRTKLPRGRIARLFFCASEGELFVLHGFIKTTQKTPPQDLTLARKRMKEIDQ